MVVCAPGLVVVIIIDCGIEVVVPLIGWWLN